VSMFDTTMRNLRRMPGDMRYAKPRSSRAGLVFLHGCGVRFPTEKATDPVRAFPLLLVAVAGKSPASQLKANHVGRGTSAAADAVVLAYRSFHRCHVSPLTTAWEVR
jgi:hypothetical protein